MLLYIFCSLLLKLTYDPDSLRNDVSNLRDELTNMMERVDASTVQGFLTAYAFLCDYFSVEYNKEVSWVSVVMSCMYFSVQSCANVHTYSVVMS